MSEDEEEDMRKFGSSGKGMVRARKAESIFEKTYLRVGISPLGRLVVVVELCWDGVVLYDAIVGWRMAYQLVLLLLVRSCRVPCPK